MSAATPRIYWHRELPPADAEPLGEHTLEATSEHVRSPLSRGDERWHQCYESLMEQARSRLEQEIARLGGDYAHVLAETIDERHNDALGEAWLHGRFDYMLFTRGTKA